MLKYGIVFPEIPEEAYTFRKRKFIVSDDEIKEKKLYLIEKTIQFQYTDLLKRIYDKFAYEFLEGDSKNLVSEISPIAGYFIYNIIKNNNIKNVWQCGVKNGIDSLYILEALKGKKFSLDIVHDNRFEWGGVAKKLINIALKEENNEKLKENIKIYEGDITKLIVEKKFVQDTKMLKRHFWQQNQLIFYFRYNREHILLLDKIHYEYLLLIVRVYLDNIQLFSYLF